MLFHANILRSYSNNNNNLCDAKSFSKQVLTVFIILSMVLLMLNIHPPMAAAVEFAGGSGNEGEPWLIETADQLNNVRNYLGSEHSNKYFKLDDHIDLDVSPYNSGAGWEPIGSEGNRFYGHFDGDGRTISNLFINRPGEDHVGLFGYTGNGFSIINVTLTGVDVTGRNAVGSLIGHGGYGLLSGCTASGNVTGNAYIDSSSGDATIRNIGGLVGFKYGTITNCTFVNVNVQARITTAVTGNALIERIGGLAGGAQNDLIENCSTIGGPQVSAEILTDVVGMAEIASIGGLIGNLFAGSIVDCNAQSHVYAKVDMSYMETVNRVRVTNVGGLVGNNDGTSGSVLENSQTISGGSVQVYVMREIEEDIYISNIGGLAGRNYYSSVTGCNATNSKTVRVTLVLVECDRARIQAIGGLIGSNYSNSPITFSSAIGEVEVSFAESVTLGGSEADQTLWIYEIGGLVGVNGSFGTPTTVEYSSSSGGVTVSVTGSTTDPTSIARRTRITAVGGLVGNNIYGDITESYSTSDVDVSLDTNVSVAWTITLGNVGGLVGTSGQGTEISGSYASGDVSVDCAATVSGGPANDFYHIGGLVGQASSSSVNPSGIRESNASGAVDVRFSGTNAGSGLIRYYGVGGLVGDSSDDTEFIECHASGDVRATRTTFVTNIYNVGGLVGTSRGVVDTCYALGDVEIAGADSENYTQVGGLVGENQFGTIINSYARGKVSGYDNVGGLVGLLWTSDATIENSYAAGLGGVIGTTNTGGLVGGNTGTGNVTNSYYDEDNTGQSDTGKGIPKSEAEMKAGFPSDEIYTGWSPLIWAFPVGEYPNFFEANPRTINVSANPPAGGTISGGGIYADGAPVTVEATANPGYDFVSWTEEGLEIHTEPSYSFTATADRTLVANFKPLLTFVAGLTSGTWYLDHVDAWHLLTTSTAQASGYGDMTGDGKKNLVLSIPSGIWYIEDGDWVRVTTSRAQTITFADVTGDGEDNFVAGLFSGTWYLDGGDWHQLTPSTATASGCGDMTGDGENNLVLSVPSGTWYIDGGDWVRVTTSRARTITFADVTGDGEENFVAGLHSGTWYLDGGDWHQLTPSTAHASGCGDMSGDGENNLVLSIPSGIWYIDGDDWFRVTTSTARTITFADMSWVE